MRMKLCFACFIVFLVAVSFFYPGRSEFQAMKAHAAELDAGSGSDTAADTEPPVDDNSDLAKRLDMIAKLLKIGLFVIVAILIINILFGGVS